MAHLSGDENMVNAFNAGEDIHTATSAKIYGVEISEVTKDMRTKTLLTTAVLLTKHLISRVRF